MSDLLKLQALFSSCLARLLLWTEGNGYVVTFGEAWRTPEMVLIYVQQGKGVSSSLHPDRLAVDLNLFCSDGTPLKTADDYRPLGEYWKSLNPLCCWGGDFHRVDADHFSVTYQGRK